MSQGKCALGPEVKEEASLRRLACSCVMLS